MYITAQGCRLRNDLYCVEWDVKLYYTIPYCNIVVCLTASLRDWLQVFLVACDFLLGLSSMSSSLLSWTVLVIFSDGVPLHVSRLETRINMCLETTHIYMCLKTRHVSRLETHVYTCLILRYVSRLETRVSSRDTYLHVSVLTQSGRIHVLS